MSRGPGKIEREIAALIGRTKAGSQPVHLSSEAVALYAIAPVGSPWGWKPNRTQRASACRAMRSFVRKHQQYALTGGKGRGDLVLYEPDDRLGALWVRRAADSSRLTRRGASSTTEG